MTLLSLKNISFKTYSPYELDILKDISFDIPKGKITTLIGPNGAGKTTLLKIILGFLKPTSGYIDLSKELIKGYMPQKITLNQCLPLCVQDFLNLCHPKKVSQDLEYFLNTLNIPSLSRKSLHHLSGGEMQRVLLAQALLGKPNLLILDEPAQGIDVIGQMQLYELITKAKELLGSSILLVSHDLHVVMGQSDHVICINGHVCCQGCPQTVQNDKLYQSLFVAFKPYHHHHDHCHDS
ncbi:MAG TPA: metal ABC transporter ATP-binding protein [Alphaproteobacteria bacterium]|nr:metal ABC transporter ATP-binding protein [Alphaproteobacteria bacterium]